MNEAVRGYFDNVSFDGWLSGWAHSPQPGKDKVRLDVYVDEIKIATISADQFRSDLAEANFSDPSCAFWFRVPDGLWDDQTHQVRILLAETSQELENSPQQLRLSHVPDAATVDNSNLIPNSSLTHWPNGVVSKPKERFFEVASRWFFDFRKDSVPDVTFSIARPNGLSVDADAFGIRIEMHEAPSGYARLVVPIDISSVGGRALLFSCGFQKPARATGNGLAIGEIFVAALSNVTLSKLSTIRKNVTPRGTLRLHGIPVDLSAVPREGMPAGRHLALVFDFRNHGELLIFSPKLAPWVPIPTAGEKTGEFEDENIQAQVDTLKLSPIWSNRRAAATKLVASVEPKPRIALPAVVAQAGLPFTQIVVPVFNAVTEVGDLLVGITKHTSAPFEVILVDDGSDQFARNRLAEWSLNDPRFRLISHSRNIGYTANINFGLQLAVADYVVLLNSDALVTPRWLEKLHEALASDDRTAAVGPVSNAASWQSVPRTKAPDGSWAVNTLRAGVSVEDYGALVERLSECRFPEFPLLNGFCTLFRKSVLEEVGFFDASAFPLGYGEENDLCIRIGRAGYRLRVADHCYVYHKKSKSFGVSKRAEISKRSNETFRSKYPELRVPELEAIMQSDDTLGHLRRALIEADSVETSRPGRVIKVMVPPVIAEIKPKVRKRRAAR